MYLCVDTPAACTGTHKSRTIEGACDLQAVAQEAGSTDIGAAGEDADAAGQQLGDHAQVNSPQAITCSPTRGVGCAGSGVRHQKVAAAHSILAPVVIAT